MKRQQQEGREDVALGVLLSFLLSVQAWSRGLAAGDESSRSQPCTACWWKLVGETLFNAISRHMKPKAEASHHKSHVQIKTVKRANFRLKVERHHQEWLEFQDAARARITELLLWGQAWNSLHINIVLPWPSAECRVWPNLPGHVWLCGWLFFSFNISFMGLAVGKKEAGNSG